MFRSFLLITFRILWRNKVTSFVNIFGLSVGITAFVLIMLYVHHETNYDKFNENYGRIYRLELDDYAKVPPVFIDLVKERIPEAENIAEFSDQGKQFISYIPDNDPESSKHIEVNFVFSNPGVFNVFTIPFLQGDPATALHGPMRVVLTESTAKKLFGETNPINKTIDYEQHQFTVTGIIRDVENSHIEMDALFSQASIETVNPGLMKKFLNNLSHRAWLWSGTYLLLSENSRMEEVEGKINNLLFEIHNRVDHTYDHAHIRPLGDVYFEGNLKNLPYGRHGNFRLIQILVAIGLFLLILAIINYVNLTTARSVVRAKEIAVKRITGSTVGQMRYQLVLESILISMVALAVATTIIQLCLPVFNQLASINLSGSELIRPFVLAGMLGGTIMIGILAGLYPSLYLTRIQPIRLMKGESVKGNEGSFFRSLLMTFQFAISIVMIVAIIVNMRQLQFVRTADLGFVKDYIVTVKIPDDIPDGRVAKNSFKERLLQQKGVEKVAYSSGSPGFRETTAPEFTFEGRPISFKVFAIDDEYFDLMGMKIVQGHSLSKEFPADKVDFNNKARNGGCLLNEAAIKEFGIDNPVGKFIYSELGGFEIVGVIKDFHVRSFHDEIEPMSIIWWGLGSITNIKIAASDVQGTIKNIETEWKKVFPQKLFAYNFLDENFDQQYRNDEQMAKVIGYFTGIAVIIACLGLFALSSFMVSRRTKEIGVRKTMGASVVIIYYMLSWDFIKWILVAIVIATPVAWYLMKMWLSTFAYHIELGIDVFVIAALIAIGIALLTVTGQSLKVARANPIDSLRYE